MGLPLVTQEDVAELMVLRDRLRRATKEYRKKREAILEVIHAGAEIEDGPYGLETTVRCVLQFQ